MATAQVTPTTDIILAKVGELVGPASAYEEKRIELRKESSAILAAATEFGDVKSQESAEKATQLGRLLQVSIKNGQEFFTSVKRQIDSIKKPVLDAEKTDIAPLEAAKLNLGRKVTTWEIEQRRIREEAERKAREEAEALAREEALARAVELEESGDIEQAEAVLDEPIVAAPVILQDETGPKISGKVTTTRYSATVVDLMVLLKAVVEGKAPIQAVLANESYIGQRARSDKEGFNIPGCKLNREESTSFRS